MTQNKKKRCDWIMKRFVYLNKNAFMYKEYKQKKEKDGIKKGHKNRFTLNGSFFFLTSLLLLFNKFFFGYIFNKKKKKKKKKKDSYKRWLFPVFFHFHFALWFYKF
jgi:hypothetical protein